MLIGVLQLTEKNVSRSEGKVNDFIIQEKHSKIVLVKHKPN
jgi:hypothetical protein